MAGMERGGRVQRRASHAAAYAAQSRKKPEVQAMKTVSVMAP